MKVDQELVVRARAGDAAAAAELIRCVWPDAYRIAWTALRDRDTAEDAAQEACARAWAGLHRLRDSRRFAVWFYRIVVNESERIRHARHPLVVVEAAAPEAITFDERIAVRAAVDALEVSLRLPIVLRYYYGLRASEIAQVMHAPAVTVRWRLMVAHRRLRAALDERASRSHTPTSSEGRYADESIAAG